MPRARGKSCQLEKSSRGGSFPAFEPTTFNKDVHHRGNPRLVLHLKIFLPWSQRTFSTFQLQLLDAYAEVAFNARELLVTYLRCCQRPICSTAASAELASKRAALPLSTLLRHCSRRRRWFSLPCSCQRSLGE